MREISGRVVAIGGYLHHMWRKLPPGFRRDLYGRVTEALAPRASADQQWPATLEAPFVVAGCLAAPTGLGEAARLAIVALQKMGLPVCVHDLTGLLRQTSVVPIPSAPPSGPGPGTLLAFVQPPNVAYAMHAIGRKRLVGKRRVGCWFWDLEVVPKAWSRQIGFVHELAVPSMFLAHGFLKAFDLPVRRLILPVAATPAAPYDRDGSIVCFGAVMDLGSTFARKNPVAVVRAYRSAFSGSDQVELVLKLRDSQSNPSAYAALRCVAEGVGARITLQDGDWDASEMMRWWSGIDVLVSLHRSEAFGLVVAEAMLRGIPVISTDWSATTEYVDRGVGWPVAKSLIPAEDETGRYALPGAVWAEPDHEAAVAAMREAASDKAARRQKGENARQQIQRLFGADAFARGLGADALLETFA